MCEESACLVPPLEPTHNGVGGEPRLSATSHASSYNGEALVGFHEDALSQAGLGKAQIILAIVLGLALAADCAEITILSFILPSAEVHLCINEQKKQWLVSTTLLAFAGGSFAWGILGDHLGRRRALISALSVAALFSASAAVMPTYGTFMTAKFCAALGISGAFPLSFSYLVETCSRATRTKYAGFLHAFWPVGAIYVALLAESILPTKGEDILQDNREHWSSWHKFLILCILPLIFAIIGLIWASESPRYLLEASREVEALAVYQRLHRLNKSRTQYGLTELELPNRNAYRERPSSPSTNVFRHGFSTLNEAIQRISSPSHFRTTLLLATLHLLLGFIYMGVTSYSSEVLHEIKDQHYKELKRFISHENYTGLYINTTLENVQYRSTLFRNTTFDGITLNHVDFFNCLFDEVLFINVKASVAYFENSTIRDSKFVDTDITDHHFIHSTLINNTFMSLTSECTADFDFNVYVDDLAGNTITWAFVMIPILIFTGFILELLPRPTIINVLFLACGLASIGMFFLVGVIQIKIVDMLVRTAAMSALNGVTMVVLEAYPCHLRCTAHGLMRSLFHIASLCAINIYGILIYAPFIFPSFLTLLAIVIAAILATRIQDNSKVLL